MRTFMDNVSLLIRSFNKPGMGWDLWTRNADDDDDYGACDEDDKQNGKGAPFNNERDT